MKAGMSLFMICSSALLGDVEIAQVAPCHSALYLQTRPLQQQLGFVFEGIESRAHVTLAPSIGSNCRSCPLPRERQSLCVDKPELFAGRLPRDQHLFELRLVHTQVDLSLGLRTPYV